VSGVQVTAAFRSPKRPSLLLVVKSAVGIVAAWLLAGLIIHGPPPVFAAIAALLVVQPSVNQSFAKGIERSVGVVVGVVIASLLGLAFGDQTWVILVAATVGLLLAWALRLTSGGTNQVAISAILVLALGTTTPGYALDRVLETLLGAAVGFVVNVVLVPPVAINPARAAMDALIAELAASFRRLAAVLQQGADGPRLEEVLLEARLLRPMRDRVESAIGAAADSLTMNPRRGKHRGELERLQAELDLYTPIVTQLIGMTRTVYDGYAPGLVDDPNVRDIAEQLIRVAHDLERDAAEAAGEPPALTTPLRIAAPSPEHWVLIGSLLEDLHRVHRALGQEDAVER